MGTHISVESREICGGVAASSSVSEVVTVDAKAVAADRLSNTTFVVH
jgi:hypothetical protein